MKDILEKYVFDKSNGLWHELNGDYYLPCFTLPKVETKEIGVWGMRHFDYLKSRRKATDQMKWVRRMNNIKQCATETVNNQLIYK